MEKCFYGADMSDGSFSGAGSTCIKKNKKHAFPPLLSSRENDWLLPTECHIGYETFITHHLYFPCPSGLNLT